MSHMVDGGTAAVGNNRTRPSTPSSTSSHTRTHIHGHRAASQSTSHPTQRCASEQRQQPPPRVLNHKVAAASLQQRQHLLKQLVEAQQELHRHRQLKQHQDALRQQEEWRQAAQQRASAYARAGEPSYASAGAGWGAVNAAASHRPHQRQPHQQPSSLPHQYRRHFDAPVDVDDYFGRGPAHTHSAGAGRSSSDARQGGSRADSRSSSEQVWWSEFAQETAGGFQYAQQRTRQQRRQEKERQGSQSPFAAFGSGSGFSDATAGRGSGPSVEHEVRFELQQMMKQCDGDLVRFVAAMGIRFERGTDRQAALRNARAAALQRLHPDKLLQASAAHQLFGAQATQMVNELWRTDGRR